MQSNGRSQNTNSIILDVHTIPTRVHSVPSVAEVMDYAKWDSVQCKSAAKRPRNTTGVRTTLTAGTNVVNVATLLLCFRHN